MGHVSIAPRALKCVDGFGEFIAAGQREPFPLQVQVVLSGLFVVGGERSLATILSALIAVRYLFTELAEHSPSPGSQNAIGFVGFHSQAEAPREGPARQNPARRPGSPRPRPLVEEDRGMTGATRDLVMVQPHAGGKQRGDTALPSFLVETPVCTTRPDAFGHASFPLAESICGGEFDGNERA